MGRSTKSIRLVLIGPTLVGSAVLVSGCSPLVEEEPVGQDWVVAAIDVEGGDWGPPGSADSASHGTANNVTHSGHRSNIGGFIGGYLGARAASGGGSAAPRTGMGSAPSSSGGSSSAVGGASARGGFGSSAGHSSAGS